MKNPNIINNNLRKIFFEIAKIYNDIKIWSMFNCCTELVDLKEEEKVYVLTFAIDDSFIFGINVSKECNIKDIERICYPFIKEEVDKLNEKQKKSKQYGYKPLTMDIYDGKKMIMHFDYDKQIRTISDIDDDLFSF